MTDITKIEETTPVPHTVPSIASKLSTVAEESIFNIEESAHVEDADKELLSKVRTIFAKYMEKLLFIDEQASIICKQLSSSLQKQNQQSLLATKISYQEAVLEFDSEINFFIKNEYKSIISYISVNACIAEWNKLTQTKSIKIDYTLSSIADKIMQKSSIVQRAFKSNRFCAAINKDNSNQALFPLKIQSM